MHEMSWKGEDKYHWNEETIETLREQMDCKAGITISLVEDVNEWIKDNISSEYEEDYIDMGVHLTKVLIGDIKL